MCHLRASGLRPIKRNYRCRVGEIDLIMADGDTLVFVEVRRRGCNRMTPAAATVDSRKQSKIVLAARQFLARHPQHARGPVRFDVVALDEGATGALQLNWIRDAFRPG